MKQVRASGVVYPLAWLTVLQKIETVAELKVIGAVWGYDGVIGIDTEPLTFGELLNRTGLSKRALQDGIKRAVKSGLIRVHKAESSPTVYILAESSPHDHDILINHDNFKFNSSNNHEHDHGADFAERKKQYEILVQEFAMARSLRIADDICFSPKYSLETLKTQIRYARWEIKRGMNGVELYRVKNPAGHLIARLRQNKPQPAGFSLEACLLEDEGWNLTDLYWAIYNGDLEVPGVKESFKYSSWLYETYEAETEGSVIDAI